MENDESGSSSSDDYEPIRGPLVKLKDLHHYKIDKNVRIDVVKMMTYLNKIHRGKGTQKMIDYVKSCNLKLAEDRALEAERRCEEAKAEALLSRLMTLRGSARTALEREKINRSTSV